MMAFINEWSPKLGVKIVCSQEMEPMGTAGPLALAREILDDGSGKPFFVLNRCGLADCRADWRFAAFVRVLHCVSAGRAA